mgnify:CR=1 FL=1
MLAMEKVTWFKAKLPDVDAQVIYFSSMPRRTLQETSVGSWLIFWNARQGASEMTVGSNEKPQPITKEADRILCNVGTTNDGRNGYSETAHVRRAGSPQNST